MKAKTIDRIKLTRQKFSRMAEVEPPKQEHVEVLSRCPNCGEETLRHEGACNICPNCGYSKCG